VQFEGMILRSREFFGNEVDCLNDVLESFLSFQNPRSWKLLETFKVKISKSTVKKDILIPSLSFLEFSFSLSNNKKFPQSSSFFQQPNQYKNSKQKTQIKVKFQKSKSTSRSKKKTKSTSRTRYDMNRFIWARGRPPFDRVNYREFVNQGAPNFQRCIRVSETKENVILWTYCTSGYMSIVLKKGKGGRLSHVINNVRRTEECSEDEKGKDQPFFKVSVIMDQGTYRVDGSPFLQFWCEFKLNSDKVQDLSESERQYLLLNPIPGVVV
jgi:hypothetical protein